MDRANGAGHAAFVPRLSGPERIHVLLAQLLVELAQHSESAYEPQRAAARRMESHTRLMLVEVHRLMGRCPTGDCP